MAQLFGAASPSKAYENRHFRMRLPPTHVNPYKNRAPTSYHRQKKNLSVATVAHDLTSKNGATEAAPSGGSSRKSFGRPCCFHLLQLGRDLVEEIFEASLTALSLLSRRYPVDVSLQCATLELDDARPSNSRASELFDLPYLFVRERMFLLRVERVAHLPPGGFRREALPQLATNNLLTTGCVDISADRRKSFGQKIFEKRLLRHVCDAV